MFTKKPEPTAFDVPRGSPPSMPSSHSSQPESFATARPAASPRPSGQSGASHIGEDLTIVGNLISKGEVHIDGQIQGDLHAANVIIGETARITGGVVADEVIVRGSVSGSVRGRRVVLQSSSRVEGDVFHQQLGIEQGAYFEGKSRRVADPLSGISAPDTSGPSSGPGFPLRGES